jgi:hypothetical protein
VVRGCITPHFSQSFCKVRGKVGELDFVVMNPRLRVALLASALMLVVLASAALASRAPTAERAPDHVASSHEPQTDAPPTADELAHAADRLAANGIDADVATLTDLAARYGLGGAVRLVAWSNETGLTVDELAAMHDEGQGWGQIARELGVHPGIGSIMGNGGGHGRDNAPGQNKPAASPAE